MGSKIKDLIIDIEELDTNEILDSWKWCLSGMRELFLVSKIGDLFLLGNDEAIYWLAIDGGGVLKKIAKDINDFNAQLEVYDNIDNWFLPGLIEQLIESGIYLKRNQVYGFKQLPVLGGEYTLDNIEPTDVSVHFALTGQICEQIKDLPGGTKIKIVIGD